MLTHAEIAALHLASYNVPGALYAAPGRVNLIGEHTDYCDGFVMPAAIDFATVVAISPRTDGRILAHSVNYDERLDKSVTELLDDGYATLRGGREVHWSDYPAGVLWALREHGVAVNGGFSLTIAGNVPLNAGLSSSASVEVATAIAVLGATNVKL
jgi:galactokinase